jgi:transposase
MGRKELLRQLLKSPTGHDARHRLHAFYEAVLLADMPETTRLAETVSTRWPAIETFLRLRVTNAHTKNTNRVIKQIKRVGCDYRNQDNHERRIVLHVTAKSAA